MTISRLNNLSLMTSFVSTLGVGSLSTGTGFLSSAYQSYRGIFAAQSADITVGFDQSPNSGTNWAVSSTVAVAAGVTTLVEWPTYGNYARLNVTAVASSADGDVFRLYVYGVKQGL